MNSGRSTADSTINKPYNLIIVGGGAAGFFAAVHLKYLKPKAEILILEKQAQVLQKVKVSGGGRCNVTHACFEPKAMSSHYPRGEKELLGPFYRFGPAETIGWFEERGVKLKTESDGRMFPTSDQSQTIINCLTGNSIGKGVILKTRCQVTALHLESNLWTITTSENQYKSKFVLWATGSSPKSWDCVAKLGHNIVPPVPSLFTFDTHDALIKDLAGISTSAKITIAGSRFENEGSLLITHRGLSGPAILKLSAFAAIYLAQKEYRFTLRVNWTKNLSEEEVFIALNQLKIERTKQKIISSKSFELPKRLWERLVLFSGISAQKTWAETNKKSLQQLAKNLTDYPIQVYGKNTFKEEFVTAGGIDRREINFKNFESKLHPGLYLAGETLDIDAVTGGFNFQNAWTGAYLASEDMVNKLFGI